MDIGLHSRIKDFIWSHEASNLMIVLRAFHEEITPFERQPGTSIPSKVIEKISMSTGLSEDIVETEMAKLTRYGLLDYDEKTVYSVNGSPIEPTEAVFFGVSAKGFDVLHQWNLTERQNNTNRVLAGLTAFLAFTAFIQANAAYLSTTGDDQVTLALGTVIAGIVIAFFVVSVI